MTIRGVPYENRGPVFGQPNNHNSWEDMSQAPAQAFRTDFSAPAPARHGNSEPLSYDGGYNNEPPKKSKRNLYIGVGAVSALVIGVGATFGLSGGSENPLDKTVGLGGDKDSIASSEIISGADCVGRDDIYQEGLLGISDGYNNVVPEYLNNLESNITLRDGESGGNGPRIDEIPADILAQIRASIDQQIERGEAPSLVNLYGERSSDADDYDGKVNDGLNACTA